MLLCGIHDGHNAAACLVRDGRVLGAVQEERLRRVKNWHGFPEQAIEALLRGAGASWGDVDAFLFNGNEYYLPPGGRPGDREAQLRAYAGNTTLPARVRRALRHTPLRTVVHRRRRQARVQPLLDRGVAAQRVLTMEHHGCHAAAAWYGSGADPDALVITLDGAGDGLCATVAVPGDDGRLKRIGAVGEEHSIGILWNVITSLMGMIPNEHEYKLMGMAPYAAGRRGKACAEIFSRAYHLHNGTWQRAGGLPEANYSFDYWRDALQFQRFDIVCAGIQIATEQLVSAWVDQWLRKTGRRRVRLAGGVFMNVKLNKVIAELPSCDDVWVFPSCGDETNTFGACWSYMAERGLADRIEPIGPLYLGPGHTEDDLRRAVERARAGGFHVSRPPDLEAAAAGLLAAGEVVARVSGREEFGARALGNRSILADPSRREIVRVINKSIKSRDFWMPFACSVLEEAQDQYLHNPKRLAAPYMILTFDSRNTDQIIAGCHPEDLTIRPQVVSRDWNPGYHTLLSRFRERTGRGAVLNTSFNIHGEPIASTPENAVDVMERSDLVHLALDDWLISKRESASA
jgi:carbamoyltransferase